MILLLVVVVRNRLAPAEGRLPVEKTFSDIVEVYMSQTPSNLIGVSEDDNPQSAHLNLTGVSQTAPSFTITTDATFSNAQWVVSNIQTSGTVPSGYDWPQFDTDRVKSHN
ncbi:MAG: hypothetical protein CEN91_466 [Candidatus Berkelbacteria bacterium Licking1014_85]|uniref:Uncharacterized protein n=1 Tax=Candidatus Berkelbacteria bacterium Licking1014_85 TaxID=2017148 RepID=A0A554LHR4_9BACT|nr:MAG: hypothetical protein CEN91_466 [Candidatus Berkelbacteria bacterium Licking1014_85]